jgi:hypothetical protein
MATGDLIQFEVMNDAALPNGGNIDGNGVIARLRFENISASATFDATKFSFLCARPGFNQTKVWSAGNVVDVINCQGLQRQPFPNGTLFLTNAVGADLDVYIALSNTVFIIDTISSVAVTSGFYGACTTSTLATGTNSSTLPYPLPIAAPLHEPHEYLGPTGTFAAEWAVDHWSARAGQTVAAVEPYITANAVSSATATTMSLSSRFTTPFPIPCYKANIARTGLTDGAGTLDAKIYPWVWGSATPWDTATQCEAWPTKNTPAGLPVCIDSDGSDALAYCYVDPAGLTTGATFSTTLPAPGSYVLGVTPAFATIAAAATAGKTWNFNGSNRARPHNDIGSLCILIPDGVLLDGLGASMTSQTTYNPGRRPFIITRAPGANVATTGLTRLTTGTIVTAPSRLKLEWISLTPGAAGATTHTLIDMNAEGAATTARTAANVCTLVASNCIGAGGNDNTNAVFSRRGYTWLHNCNLAAFGKNSFVSNAGLFVGIAQVLGCTLDNRTNDGIASVAVAAMAATIIGGSRIYNYITPLEVSGAVQPQLGAMKWNTRFDIATVASADRIDLGNKNGIGARGSSAMNLLVRQTAAAGTPGVIDGGEVGALYCSADFESGPTEVPAFQNMLITHVTVAGGRFNIGYNEINAVRVAKFGRLRFLAADRINTKMDYHAGPGTPTQSGARTGSMAFRAGTSSEGVRLSQSDSQASSAPGYANWVGEFARRGQAINIGFGNMYVSRTDLAGTNVAGNDGDYTPLAALFGAVPSGAAAIAFDLVGNARRIDGTGAAGAIERPADAASGWPARGIRGAIRAAPKIAVSSSAAQAA